MNPLKLSQGFEGNIAGLRGFAVLLIVMFHFDFPFFHGIFFGVDIFLVISGFLVTGLLVREFETNRAKGGFGWISLRLFYFKRARRLLPPSLVLSVAVLIYSFLTQNQYAFLRNVGDFWWSFFCASNVNFYVQSVDYFNHGSSPSVFLHYWSLSLQEQFYAIWPLLFLFAASMNALVFRGRLVGWRTRAFVLVAAISLASLVWMIIDFNQNPNEVYFSLTARAWEIGAGSLCALIPTNKGAHSAPRIIAGYAGVAVLAASFWLVQASNFAYTLPIAIAGSCLVILFVRDGSPLGRLVANPGLIFLANISYSLYLWHWPILIFAEAGRSTNLDLNIKWILLLASLVAASLSWAFVERPSMRLIKIPYSWELQEQLKDPESAVLNRNALSVGAFALAVGLNLAPLGATFGNQLAQQNTKIALSSYKLAAPTDVGQNSQDSNGVWLEWQAIVRNSVVSSNSTKLTNNELAQVKKYLSASGPTWYDESTWKCVRPLPAYQLIKRCTIGPSSATRQIVAIGDSHIEMFTGALYEISQLHPEVKITTWSHQACPNSNLTQIIKDRDDISTQAVIKSCEYFHHKLFQLLGADLRGAQVLLADAPPRDTAHYSAGNIALIQRLAEKATSVWTIGTTPSYGALKSCLNRDYSNKGSCSGRFSSASTVAAQDALITGTGLVKSANWLCAAGICPVFIDGSLVTADGQHLTLDMSARLAPLLWDAIN
jgi:peptidoglycan/LPS O-acetylase OafA/YrhL